MANESSSSLTKRFFQAQQKTGRDGEKQFFLLPWHWIV